MSEDIDLSGISSVAASSGFAVNNNLRGEGHIRPSSVSDNVDSVSDGAGSALGPAAAAVNWNVLILGPWEPVSVVDVSPVPSCGQCFHIEILVRSWRCYYLFHAFYGFSFAGVFLSVQRKFWLGLFGFWLGFISDIFGPGVRRSGPWAGALNAEIVNSSNQSEISSFSPIAAPRVSNNPKFDSIFLPPSHNWNIVIQLFSASLVVEDSSSIVDQLLGDCNGAGNWSSLVDLVYHVALSADISELVNTVNLCPFLSPASFVWEAVFAFNFRSTSNTVVMPISLIGWTGLISNAVVVNPFVSCSGVTPWASLIWQLAWDQDLRT